MVGTFPTLSTGSVAMYPVSRSLAFPAKVVRFLDDSEQRWVSGAPLNQWALTFARLKWADVLTLKAFFENQKGAFDSSWTFGIAGSSYTSMAFDQDDFTYTETGPAKFSVSLKVRQTKNTGTYASAVPAQYPAIQGSVIVQFPFQSSPSFLTTRNDTPAGLRYAYYWRQSPRFRWTLRYPTITDAECGTLLDFFASMSGQYSTFYFTDPETGIVHPKCRFGMDQIKWTYIQPGLNSVDVVIEETA